MNEARATYRTGSSPLVSLVMAVWNARPEWLRAAVASALAQSGCDIELVVVDDGSDPPVLAVLERVEDERLRLIRVPHGRVSRARNAGIAAAGGDYLRFVDSDDVIVSDSTAHLLSLAGGSDEVITYGATVICDERLRPLSTIATQLQGRVAEHCLLNRFDTTLHSLLIPRRVVEAIGPWEPSIHVSQDWDYALRALEHAPVRGDERVATYYRTHPGMNSRDVERGIDGYRRVVERYFERHPERRGSDLHHGAEMRFHLFAAVQLATRLRRYREAWQHLRRAFALDPAGAVTTLPRQAAMPLLPTLGRGRRALGRIAAGA
jgi:glycosyltransferase involved in cell wall biosynthesis